jgi:SHS2 domain-containing protein
VDHTSEVQLQVEAASLAELAAEAGRALGLLMLRGEPAAASGSARMLEVLAVDRDALLVNWLNEILFVAETELWVPVEFAVEESSPTRLRVAAWGVPVAEPPSIVKAATFHGLKVEESGGLFRAEVIFDV